MEKNALKTPLQERWVMNGIEESPNGLVARIERTDGETFILPLSDLASGVKEGDILAVYDGPDGVKAEILTEETAAAQQAQQERLTALNNARNNIEHAHIEIENTQIENANEEITV